MQAHHFAGISARGIEVWRGERRVLRNVSFELRGGDCLHVLGPNGSGKTTLLRVVAGLLVPEQGIVEWRGRTTRSQRDAWCASLSYLAHSDGLKPEMTARENLVFETALRRSAQPQEISVALSEVGLGEEGDLAAGAFSAGQRRRLALARVMLAAAPLWILDEPYTNLDAEAAGIVTEVIGRHLDGGGAALIAAHQPPVIPNRKAHRLELT